MRLNATPNWIIPPDNRQLAEKIGRELRISPLLAGLMINRGITGLSEASTFLWGTLADLHNPFLMKDMDKATELILAAMNSGHRICVYGDYDVDGLSAAALLSNSLQEQEADVLPYIPHRLQEGYGLNPEAIKELHKEKVRLIVTVDCGITSCREIELANSLGMQVIITDHHQLGSVMPEAAALINPLQPDCPYPFKHLAGVGLAFKLAQGVLAQANRLAEAAELLHNSLDLVALGTVADMAPLTGENRILVKYGLKQLTNPFKSGIKALKQVSGLDRSQEIKVGDIAFKLAPRLNAAGRMGDPRQGLELLTTDDRETGDLLAQKVEEKNRRRRDIENKILAEAKEQLRATAGDIPPKAIVLASEEWHVGVIGIVASRLMEEFFRPTIVIALQDGTGKGSARSIRNLHLQQTLLKCQDLLQEFGGHEMAAGLSVARENIPALRQRFNELVCEALTSEDFIPRFATDGEIDFSALTLPMWEELQYMAPCGTGNPAPAFCARQVMILRSPRTVGKNHLKLTLQQKGQILDSIGFNMGDLSAPLADLGGGPIDVVFRPQLNVWQGREQIQLHLQDIAASANQEDRGGRV